MSGYVWDPTDYAKNSSAQAGWARELVAKLTLTGSESILDIGCGDGRFTAELASRVPTGRVLGVDLSNDMVQAARHSFPVDRFANLTFGQCDAGQLNFDHEFDVVFSNAALHWIADHRPVLAGISRCLRPGGQVLLQMGGQGNAAPLMELVNQMMRDARWREHFVDFSSPYGFHSPEDYGDWLEEAGLAPRRVELIPKDMIHDDRSTFVGWIRTTWLPYTQRVPATMRDEFIDELVDTYLQRRPADANGAVHVPMVRLEVQATRE